MPPQPPPATARAQRRASAASLHPPNRPDGHHKPPWWKDTPPSPPQPPQSQAPPARMDRPPPPARPRPEYASPAPRQAPDRRATAKALPPPHAKLWPCQPNGWCRSRPNPAAAGGGQGRRRNSHVQEIKVFSCRQLSRPAPTFASSPKAIPCTPPPVSAYMLDQFDGGHDARRSRPFPARKLRP